MSLNYAQIVNSKLRLELVCPMADNFGPADSFEIIEFLSHKSGIHPLPVLLDTSIVTKDSFYIDLASTIKSP